MYFRTVTVVFLILMLISGGFSLAVGAAASACLILCLLIRCRGKGGSHDPAQLMFPKGAVFYGICAMPLFAALSLIYAVDRGEAFTGLIKFMILPIFALSAAQLSGEERRSLFDLIPWVGAAATAFCTVAYVTPLRDFFFPDGRLGGCFVYPNTYALFLLIAVIVLCQRNLERKWDRLLFVICITGIFLTGSRSVFVLMILYLLYACIMKKDGRKSILLMFLICICIVIPVALLSGSLESFMRGLFWESAGGSTFWGRLLYWYDGLGMLKEFPMGMGYMGYYFLQGSFQTGNYAVMYAHNDLLQCALDFGIPCALIMAGIAVYSLFSRKTGSTQKLILLVLSLHSLFDFDFQFLAMDLIFVLCLAPGGLRPVRYRKAAACLLAILLCLEVYGLLFSGLQALGSEEAAVKLYPGLTRSQLNIAQQSTDFSEREELADKVISRNQYCAAAYKVKAENAAAENRFYDMEEYARKAVSCDPYNPLVYEDYLKDISFALDYYVRAGENEKAAEFLQYAAATDELMQQAERSASTLAFKIDDKPAPELSDEYKRYLDQMNKLWEETGK